MDGEYSLKGDEGLVLGSGVRLCFCCSNNKCSKYLKDQWVSSCSIGNAFCVVCGGVLKHESEG